MGEVREGVRGCIGGFHRVCIIGGCVIGGSTEKCTKLCATGCIKRRIGRRSVKGDWYVCGGGGGIRCT